MAKVLSKEEWKRRKRIMKYVKLGAIVFIAVLLLLIVLLGGLRVVRNLFSRGTASVSEGTTMKQELGITELFLTPNQYSRPQNELAQVKGIIIHDTSQAGASAVTVRNQYESLKSGTGTSDSSHFILGLSGEIVQCIPLDEIALASAERNQDSIAISFCYPQPGGTPEDSTYAALVKLTVYLCQKYDLKTDAVFRHSDVKQDACPHYFAEQTGTWDAFLANVNAALAEKK